MNYRCLAIPSVTVTNRLVTWPRRLLADDRLSRPHALVGSIPSQRLLRWLLGTSLDQD
jgi:hypothetical protein